MKVFRLKPPRQKSLPVCISFRKRCSPHSELSISHLVFRANCVWKHPKNEREDRLIPEYNDGERQHEDAFSFKVRKSRRTKFMNYLH